ncbi:hypothetical protein CHLRE_01g054600v5 [Chlamydomonas reinhardtii]|uniref:TIR domain-containing protein n=1 Tax=Chlamydomonas reinhardtii TaxID=3055 RepID=A0A2K3E8A1_CHLRE|nr:uncharacterized protein CHLRE_01g054600v5 [Chlamydomonas reinhardtii]PNW89011.1 hypothetical protein CHLRE_01g054600v5 [Chlamydomonas reinhardtii]
MRVVVQWCQPAADAAETGSVGFSNAQGRVVELEWVSAEEEANAADTHPLPAVVLPTGLAPGSAVTVAAPTTAPDDAGGAMAPASCTTVEAGAWLGTLRDGVLRLSAAVSGNPAADDASGGGPALQLTLELVPQPHLFHIALACRADEAGGLQQRLLCQWRQLVRPSKPLRVIDACSSAAAPKSAAAAATAVVAAAGAATGAAGSSGEESVVARVAASGSLLVLLSPGVWACSEVLAAVRAAQERGLGVLLLFLAAPDAASCHVPSPPTPASPPAELFDLARTAAVDLGQLIGTAPADFSKLFEDAYLAPRPGAAPPPAPLRLPSAHLPRFYYEGVAYHRPPDGGPVLLRGWYQVEAEFEADARRIHLDVSYEPKAGRSMPKYKHRMELEWEAQGAGGVLQLGEVKQGKYWGRWTGEAVGGEGGELQLTEEEDFIVLRPQPFFYHFYLAGAPDGAASLGVRLASGLHEQSSPGCRIRLFRSLGASTEERAAALSCSAAVLAVLSPGAWSDPGFVSDLERAAARGLPVLFLYDPDPRMASHVELSACVASAPPGPVSALLRRSDVSALYRRWYEQDACLQHLMRSAGFGRCVHLPTDHDQFVFELHEARSDTASLQLMREGRWLYYEGQAAREGNVWGWYQLEARFQPELDLIELWVEFESKHTNSIPSYKARFQMQWDTKDNSVVERGLGRWKGHVDGIGGVFSLRNNFGDALTFRPQPFIWHFFLSHVQRESSDCCAALALALTELSVRGRRMRAWYDNKASALTKEAMALGIVHSRNFALFLSPSTFKSMYVKFEIQTALSQGKRTLLIHDPDPSSRIHVDLAAARQEAPEDLRPIFDGPCLAWPGFGGDVDGVTRELMGLGGFQDWFRPRGHEESQ